MNRSTTTIPFKKRLIVFVVLWVISGLAWSLFAEYSVEAGDSLFAAQAEMVYLGPLMAAEGLAFVIVPGGYNAWPGREAIQGVLSLVILCGFIVHAIAMLSAKSCRAFLISSAIQAAFLSASVVAVLYYWHWDAIHMHG